MEDMGLDALNADTIKGYRVIFEQLHEGHPWNKLMKDEFLMKLKAAAKNKEGTVSPTVAGLLMFGDADRITDVFPTGANDVYEVRAEGRRPIYLPAISQVVQEINIQEGYMRVAVPDGLLDEA